MFPSNNALSSITYGRTPVVFGDVLIMKTVANGTVVNMSILDARLVQAVVIR